MVFKYFVFMFGKGSSFILIIMTDEWDKTTVEFSSDLFVEGEVAGTFLKTINDLPIRPSERKGRAGGLVPRLTIDSCSVRMDVSGFRNDERDRER